MKLIAYGGTKTKYTKDSTKDAIILALNTDFVDGLKLDAYLTNDNVLVVIGESILQELKLSVDEIEKMDYQKLRNYNIGNKVKKSSIITLREALSLFENSKKILVICLKGFNKNDILVDTLKNTLKLYQDINLYVESKYLDIIKYLETSDLKTKIGLVVDDKTLKELNFAFDFYTYDINNYDNSLIRTLYNQNKEIFIDNVNTEKDISDVYKRFSNIFEDIFIETKNPVTIYSYYVINIKKSVE